MADNQYTIPITGVIYTTGTVGDLNPTDQLPLNSKGLHEYPTATKTWTQSIEDPDKTHTVFTRDIITTELPGADGTGNGANAWTNATSSISYTDEGYGREV